MTREEAVLARLARIMDPDLGRDIVSLGFIKDLEISEEGLVRFTIELTTPACPVRERFRSSAREEVAALDWVSGVEVKLSARPRKKKPVDLKAIAAVHAIVAVASCKGGVGKSTVATNLAFAMQDQGARVGIFDADIYGPSLPTMVEAPCEGLVKEEGGLIRPIVHESGMKLMSFGYGGGERGPAIMRGPMVSKVIHQLLLGVEWGELDYLILDMPPGTGDIPLTLTQMVPFDAAIIVTTPQKISFIDVEKGIQMFDKLNIPVVAVVENMSYFVCDGCDKRHQIFGQGARKMLVEQFGIENAFEIPLVPAIARQGDSGLPLAAADREGMVGQIYREIAERTIREVSKVKFGQQRPEIDYDSVHQELICKFEEQEGRISTEVLRRNCPCVLCSEEQVADLSEESLALERIESMGNYAIRLIWKDGHSSIFPYTRLRELMA